MAVLIWTSIVWAASFLLVTQGVSAVPKAAMWLARLAGAVSLVPLAMVARQWRRSHLMDAAVVGGLGVGAFFLLETVRRAQWGPSGAESLFMLSTVPLWVALACLVRRRPGAGLALLAALFVMLANVMILANWERPSSFAPFALFGRADLALLVAAAAFGVGGLEAERRLADVGALGRAAIAGLGATLLIVALPALTPAGGLSLTGISQPGDWTLLAAIAVVGGAALLLLWHESVKAHGALAASFACGIAPAVLSAYVVVEKPFGTEHGPLPLILAPVVAGVVLSLVAAFAGITAAGRGAGSPAPRRGRSLPAMVLASTAALAALAGMWLPSLWSHLESHLTSGGYSIGWRTSGYATIGPWLALAAVLVAVAAPVDGEARWVWLGVLAATGAAVAAGGWSLWNSWHAWIPSDVQQALGSPYALLSEYPIANAGVLLAPWLALAAFAARVAAASTVAARGAAPLARKVGKEVSIISIVVMLSLPFATGCSPKVTVRTGTRVICRYGHTVSDGTRTLRVAADRAWRYRITTVYTVCATHRKAEELMSAAASATAAGDSADAKKLAEQALALAPDVSDPQGLASKLGVSGTGRGGAASKPNGGAQTSRPTGGGIVSPTDLMSSIPRSLSGYAFVSENRSDVAATRTFRALSGKPKQLVIQVTYLGSSSAYGPWFAARIKNHYSVSASTSLIGARRVYFGTDGKLFATAAWRSGASALQVEAAGGARPSALKPAIVAVVGKLP